MMSLRGLMWPSSSFYYFSLPGSRIFLPLLASQMIGGELFERIRNAGRFSEDEARYFFQQLISGVSYCHFMVLDGGGGGLALAMHTMSSVLGLAMWALATIVPCGGAAAAAFARGASDHTCTPANRASASSVSIPLAHVLKVASTYTQLGAHVLFPAPAAAASAKSLPGWMYDVATSSSVQPVVITTSSIPDRQANV